VKLITAAGGSYECCLAVSRFLNLAPVLFFTGQITWMIIEE
jgi:hypothetical protein